MNGSSLQLVTTEVEMQQQIDRYQILLDAVEKAIDELLNAASSASNCDEIDSLTSVANNLTKAVVKCAKQAS